MTLILSNISYDCDYGCDYGYGCGYDGSDCHLIAAVCPNNCVS